VHQVDRIGGDAVAEICANITAGPVIGQVSRNWRFGEGLRGEIGGERHVCDHRRPENDGRQLPKHQILQPDQLRMVSAANLGTAGLPSLDGMTSRIVADDTPLSI
jgi:hypothetical protein